MLPKHGSGCSAVLDGVDILVRPVPDIAGDDHIIGCIDHNGGGLVRGSRPVIKGAPGYVRPIRLEFDGVVIVVGVTSKIPVAGHQEIPLGIHNGSLSLLGTGFEVALLPDDIAAGGERVTGGKVGKCQDQEKPPRESTKCPEKVICFYSYHASPYSSCYRARRRPDGS